MLDQCVTMSSQLKPNNLQPMIATPIRRDKYGSFQELAAGERCGVDFSIYAVRRDSPVAIIAPHGGMIDPGTSDLARAITASIASRD